MQYPSNLLDLYIGIPVLYYLAISGFIRNRKYRNTTSWYTSLMCLTEGTAMIFYGIPAILTTSTKYVSYGTAAADVLQAIALLFLWLIVIRAFLGNRPRAALVARIAILGLTAVLLVTAITRNMTPPYSTMVVQNVAGHYNLIFAASLSFAILNGIDSISFVLLAVFFWVSSREAAKGPKIRVRGMCIAFLIAGSAFLIGPAVTPDQQSKISLLLFSLSFVSIIISQLLAAFVAKD